MSDDPRDQMSMDYETASFVDLKKTGSHVYSEHPSTKPHCMAYGMPGDEPDLWQPGMPFPKAIKTHLEKGRKLRGWNVRFETDISQNVMTRDVYGWPFIRSDRFVCTQAEALALSLPATLEGCGTAVGAAARKDDAGHRVMLQLARPRTKTKKRVEPQLWGYWDDPEKFEQLFSYCLDDVRAEQAIVPFLRRLSPVETRIFEFTRDMNERGIAVDLDLVDRMQALVDRKIELINAELAEVTDGTVLRVSNVQALREWINVRLGREYLESHDLGLEIETLAKDDIADLLVLTDLPNTVRRALEIRQEAGKASTAKLKAFRDRASADGRARNGFRYYGASTGRWSSHGVQMQNLVRPAKGLDVDAAIADIKAGAGVQYIESAYGMSIMTVVAGCLRGCMTARARAKLADADKSQIEARVSAYLANETLVIEAFRAYDRKEGPDIYKIAAAGIYMKPHAEIDSEERGVGKIAVLALGFGGGAMALLKMAHIYRIDLAPLLDGLLDVADQEDYQRMLDGWESRGRRSGVRMDEWQAAEMIKILWRKANPNIAAMWRVMEEKAKAALRNPGKVIHVPGGHGLAFQKTGSGLRLRVPRGDFIYFPGAQIRKQTEAERKADEKREETERQREREVFEAMAWSNGKWKPCHLYGGLLFQNAVQRTARDVIADDMLQLEAMGFNAVAIVHDEELAEVPEDMEGADKRMIAVMSAEKSWLPGLPVAADGWEHERFKKA